MANAWNLADEQLQEMLDAWIEFILLDVGWELHLYQNNYTPVPGDDLEDYVEANFPGYAPADLDNTQWGPAAVVLHVAISTYALALNFLRAASGGASQTIFGYYVTDGAGDYRWGERFEQSRTMAPSDQLSLTPLMRHGVMPA